LIYGLEGAIGYNDVMEMTGAERTWWLERLVKQLKKEADAVKKAGRRKR
jgi:hypothetical protein